MKGLSEAASLLQYLVPLPFGKDDIRSVSCGMVGPIIYNVLIACTIMPWQSHTMTIAHRHFCAAFALSFTSLASLYNIEQYPNHHKSRFMAKVTFERLVAQCKEMINMCIWWNHDGRGLSPDDPISARGWAFSPSGTLEKHCEYYFSHLRKLFRSGHLSARDSIWAGDIHSNSMSDALSLTIQSYNSILDFHFLIRCRIELSERASHSHEETNEQDPASQSCNRQLSPERPRGDSLGCISRGCETCKFVPDSVFRSRLVMVI